MDNLINQTHTNSSLAVFHQYATVTAQQLPYIWMPNAYTVAATSTKLHNVAFNSFGGIYPEYATAFESFDPHQLDGSRWHEAYRRVAPDPGAWTSLVVKLNELDRSGEPSWPRARLEALAAPVLLIIGDSDIVRPELHCFADGALRQPLPSAAAERPVALDARSPVGTACAAGRSSCSARCLPAWP